MAEKKTDSGVVDDTIKASDALSTGMPNNPVTENAAVESAPRNAKQGNFRVLHTMIGSGYAADPVSGKPTAHRPAFEQGQVVSLDHLTDKERRRLVRLGAVERTNDPLTPGVQPDEEDDEDEV